MDFFQKLFSPGPQVGNYEAIGQVWLKNSDSKWPKKLRQNGSSVDDSRPSRVNIEPLCMRNFGQNLNHQMD